MLKLIVGTKGSGKTKTMIDMIDKAVEALSKKFSGGFSSTAKFVIKDEGAIIIDENGVRAGDDEWHRRMQAADAVVAQAVEQNDGARLLVC